MSKPEEPIFESDMEELHKTKVFRLLMQDLSSLEEDDVKELRLGVTRKVVNNEQLMVKLTDVDTWYLRGRLSVIKWLKDVLEYGKVDGDANTRPDPE